MRLRDIVRNWRRAGSNGTRAYPGVPVVHAAPTPSKYTPHQGQGEKDRRVRQMMRLRGFSV